jgi:hypothetical protein
VALFLSTTVTTTVEGDRVSETLAERRRIVEYLRRLAGESKRHGRFLVALRLLNLANGIERGEHLHPSGQ